MLETSEPGILDAAAGFHYRWWDMRKSQTFVSQDPDPISCKAPEESHNKAQVGAGAQDTSAGWMAMGAEPHR